MTANVGYATLDVIPEVKGAAAALTKGMVGPAGQAGATSGTTAGKAFGGSMLSTAKSFIGPLAAISAGASLLGFAKDAFAEAQEAQKTGALTQSVIEATGGAAKVTRQEVEELAGALSNKIGVDDEAIQAGQNMLLTFKNIRNEAGAGNDIFNQSTIVLADMAAAMGTDMKTSAVQLGKALNDPVKGISALSRVGVTFTEEQKKQIAGFVKSGDVMEAQKIILRELQSEFGGAAAAVATPADKAKVSWANFQEFVGLKVMPLWNKVLALLPQGLEFLMGLFAQAGDRSTTLGSLVGTVSDALRVLIGWVQKGVTWLGKHRAVAIALAAGIALLVSPVTTVIAVLVLAYKRSETFRKIVAAVFGAVRGFLASNEDRFKSWWATLQDIWSGAVALWQAIWVKVRQFWDAYGAQILATLTSAWQHIWQVIKLVWDSIATVISTALAVIKGIINAATALIQGRWGDAWDAILGVLDAVWDGIWHLISNGFKIAGQLLGLGLDALRLLWSLAWDGVKALASAAIDVLVGWVTALPGKLAQLGALIWDWIRERATHIAGDVAAAVVGFFNWVQGLPAQFGEWGALIWDWIREKALHIAADVIYAFASFKEWITNLPSLLASWAGDVWGWIVESAGDAGAAAWEAFKSAFLGGSKADGSFWDTFIHGLAGSVGIVLPPTAEGGVVTQAQARIVGEAGPEAIMPLDRLERVLDKAYAAGQRRGSDGAAQRPIEQHNTINVYNPINEPTSTSVRRLHDRRTVFA